MRDVGVSEFVTVVAPTLIPRYTHPQPTDPPPPAPTTTTWAFHRPPLFLRSRSAGPILGHNPTP